MHKVESILILQHAWDDHKGYLGTLLDSYNIPCTIIDVPKQPIPDPSSYAAVIALGGGQHVYHEHKHPYFTQEKAILRQIIAQNIPYLGICLGAQLLASALGANVWQHTMTEIGFYNVQLTEEGQHDPLYTNLPGYQRVFHWHEDTFALPPGAVLLATSTNTTNQAFRYGQRAYALQYHIEVDMNILDTWLYHPQWQKEIVSTLGEDTYRAIEQEKGHDLPLYHQHTRTLFKNFLKISHLID